MTVLGAPFAHENPGNSLVETVHQPGSLAKVLQGESRMRTAIEHLTTRARPGPHALEITLEMDEEADRSLYERIGQLADRAPSSASRTGWFNRHRGGKIRTVARLPINTRQVLRECLTRRAGARVPRHPEGSAGQRWI